MLGKKQSTLQCNVENPVVTSEDEKRSQQTPPAEPVGLVSLFSRQVRLVYFVVPLEAAIATETFRDILARRREVPFSRNLNVPIEKEAHAHRTVYLRFCSFYDDPQRRVGCTRWARSMKLAALLARSGFYLSPPSQQSSSNDKVSIHQYQVLIVCLM